MPFDACFARHGEVASDKRKQLGGMKLTKRISCRRLEPEKVTESRIEPCEDSNGVGNTDHGCCITEQF